MKISQKNLLIVCFLFLLLVCILCNSKKTAEFAYIGLNTWYLNMIPSLFPFMVLLNLLISTGFSYWFMKPFSVFLKPFRNTEDACFVLFFRLFVRISAWCEMCCGSVPTRKVVRG